MCQGRLSAVVAAAAASQVEAPRTLAVWADLTVLNGRRHQREHQAQHQAFTDPVVALAGAPDH
jgi:hypothetical protein